MTGQSPERSHLCAIGSLNPSDTDPPMSVPQPMATGHLLVSACAFDSSRELPYVGQGVTAWGGAAAVTQVPAVTGTLETEP